MIVSNINSTYKTNCYAPMMLGVDNNYKNKKKDNMLKIALGIGVTGMIITGIGIATKGNFNKTIAKKGLELQNNILVNKQTGEKFTGNIKSYIGKMGFNRIETQAFVDGVITEKTYKNAIGRELSGTFYIDGKECLNIQVGYPFIVPYNKAVTTYRYTEDRKGVEQIYRRDFSEKSVFEWARKYVKERGWLKNKD